MLAAILLALAATACQPANIPDAGSPAGAAGAPAGERPPDADATPVPPPQEAATGEAEALRSEVPPFVGRVWRVDDAGASRDGTTYAFLADGTLVVDAPGGTPSRGRWQFGDGGLVITEDGLDHPTDIVAQTTDTLLLRSHNPGGAVEIPLVAAPGVPLPSADPAE